MFDNGDNGPDVGAIFNAIVEASKIGVDPRVILCIIMQESHGNVGIETSTAPDGSQSAGLMQCDGSPGFPGHHSPQVTQVCLNRSMPDLLNYVELILIVAKRH